MVASPISHLHSFGSYEEIRRLGAGGMAEVFLARQHMAAEVSRLVVIKALLPHLASDEQFVEMFRREAKIAAQLTHPNIVQIYDVTSNIEGRPAIVMEFLRGRDLWNVLRRISQTDRAISPLAAAAVVAQASSGLDHAHRLRDEKGRPINLVHRDISPQNVFLTRDGHVRVLDFGIAKSRYQEQRTQEGVLKGKLPYMAPEQARGKDIDGRADQFALGVILWEMLSGRRLFARDDPFHTMNALFTLDVPPPSAISPNAPRGLDPIVLRALARSVQERYESCESFAQALRDWLRAQNAPAEAALVAQLLEDACPSAEDAELYGFDAAGTSTSVRNPDMADGRTRVDAQTQASGGAVGEVITGLRPTPRASAATMTAQAHAIAEAQTRVVGAMPAGTAAAAGSRVTATATVAPAVPTVADAPTNITWERPLPAASVAVARPKKASRAVWLVAVLAGGTAVAAGIGITAALLSDDPPRPQPIVPGGSVAPPPSPAPRLPDVSAAPTGPRQITVRFLAVPNDVRLEVDAEPIPGTVLTTRSSPLVRHVRALRDGREVWRYDGIFQDSTAVALPELTVAASGGSSAGTSRGGGHRSHTPRPRPPPATGSGAPRTGLGNGIDLGYP